MYDHFLKQIPLKKCCCFLDVDNEHCGGNTQGRVYLQINPTRHSVPTNMKMGSLINICMVFYVRHSTRATKMFKGCFESLNATRLLLMVLLCDTQLDYFLYACFNAFVILPDTVIISGVGARNACALSLASEYLISLFYRLLIVYFGGNFCFMFRI